MAGKVDLKVVLLGKEYGGKTSLVERYIHGKFNSNAPYQSVSCHRTVLRLDLLSQEAQHCPIHCNSSCLLLAAELCLHCWKKANYTMMAS